MRPPRSRVAPPRGHAGGSGAAARGAAGSRAGCDPARGFRDIAGSCQRCPGFLPLSAGRSGEIRLLGNDSPFAQEEPDLCTAGQRMLLFYVF